MPRVTETGRVLCRFCGRTLAGSGTAVASTSQCEPRCPDTTAPRAQGGC